MVVAGLLGTALAVVQAWCVAQILEDSLFARGRGAGPYLAVFAAVALLRAAAHTRRSTRPAADTESGGEATPSWPEVWGLLRKLIGAHGRSGEDRALAALDERTPIVAAFARSVGWKTITTADSDYDLKFAWRDFAREQSRSTAA